MTNPYQVQSIRGSTPEALNKTVLTSICLYLQDYKDTSKTKEDRKISLRSAQTIIDWLIFETRPRINSFETEILYFGYCKIQSSINEAIVDFNNVYNMNDSIGFLKILIGENKI